MRAKSRRMGLAFLTLVAAWGFSVVHADEAGRLSLRGLQGTAVEVTGFGTEIEQDGLTETQLKNEVESKLRKAGISVLSNVSEAPGYPLLSLIVNLVKCGGELSGLYACSVQLLLSQSVILERAASISVPGRTWHSKTVAGVIGREKLSTVRSHAASLAEEFVNDYLAVNPKVQL